MCALHITPLQSNRYIFNILARIGPCLYTLTGFHTEGGGAGGGFIPLMILARGGYPPHQTAEQCFFNGHFSEVLQESVQKTNPLFFSKFVFSNCPPPPP